MWDLVAGWLGRHATLSQEAYLGRLTNLQDYELATTSGEPPNELEDFIVQVTGWAYGLETMFKLDPRARVFGDHHSRPPFAHS